MLKKIAVFLVVAMVLLGGTAWWAHDRMYVTYRGFTEPEVFVELPPGSSVADIAARLTAAGVVPDAWSFRLAARLSGAERRLKAGEYRFAESASPIDVVARLERGEVFRRPVTFPEGLTIVEMGALAERAELVRAADFARAASDGSRIQRFDPEARTLEGYLFPSTYTFARRAESDTVIEAMIDGFERAFDARLREAAAARHMTVRDAVTLASLIEKETAQPDERPIVSGVYHNRLARDMPLQCDPTVIYALMLAGKWNGNIQRVHLQMDSPYNTYRFPGLPPGPIASPGRASLEAAVFPADVTYLYFVSRNDGTHVFAETLAEHNRNVDRWQKR
jgi:UPF0755 protein